MGPEYPLVQLYELRDATRSRVVRLTNNSPVNLRPVGAPTLVGIWISGNGWYCAPIELRGIERSIGRVPAPILRIGLTPYVQQHVQRSLLREGTTVTRIQTDGRALEARNWGPGKANPWTGTSALTQHRVDRWNITRVLSQDETQMRLELRDEMDFWTDIVRPDLR